MHATTSCGVATIPQNGCLLVQGRLLQFTRAGFGAPRVGGGRRGKVTSFSAGSRRRMLQWLSIVDWPSMVAAAPAYFVTLTTPPEYWSGPGRVRAPLARFRRRFERRFPSSGDSAVSVVWKMERGESRGMLHFHLLVLGVPHLSERWVRNAWRDSLRHDAPVIADVQSCADPERVGKYLAKYVGKPTPAILGAPVVSPRGVEGDSEGTPQGEGAGECDSPCLSHISGRTLSDSDLHGRWWGVWNKDSVIYAPLTLIGEDSSKWAARLRRIVRRWRKAQVLETLERELVGHNESSLQLLRFDQVSAHAARRYHKRRCRPKQEGERPTYDALLFGRLVGFTVYGSADVLCRLSAMAA